MGFGTARGKAVPRVPVRHGEGVLIVPALMLLFSRIQNYYRTVGLELGLGLLPHRPQPSGSLVIVPVGAISKLTEPALQAALSLGDEVIAVSVHPEAGQGTIPYRLTSR
jgi:hypothetical protein